MPERKKKKKKKKGGINVEGKIESREMEDWRIMVRRRIHAAGIAI
jgi:hypothetical protein